MFPLLLSWQVSQPPPSLASRPPGPGSVTPLAGCSHLPSCSLRSVLNKNNFKKCVRGMPLVPKILPRLLLVLAVNSQLLIGASAHLRGRRPCVFLLCSLMTLNRPGSCLSGGFCLVFLCLARSPQGCAFLPSRSQLKYHLPCGGRGRASMTVLPGPPLLPTPLWRLTFITLLRASVLESILPGVNCLSPLNSKRQGWLSVLFSVSLARHPTLVE